MVARWRGYAWLWKNRDRWLQQREELRREGRMVDSLLLAGTSVSLPLDQVLGKRPIAALIGRLTTPLYRLSWPGAVR